MIPIAFAMGVAGDPAVNPLLRAGGGLAVAAINAAVGVVMALGARATARVVLARVFRRPTS